jgi:F0F1-type ATP synthase membrane subunit b/b'
MTKRMLWLLVFVLLSISPVYSRQNLSGGAAREERREEKEDTWKWANFALLVAGLGYLAAKNAPAFFNARSEEIQKAIKDATGLKVQADFRSSEMDRRMATLQSEIQKLREQSKAEAEREAERISQETQAAVARIQEHTNREMEALRYQASLAVRERAVRLAADLAVARLREHPEEVNQNELVRTFAADVAKGAK